MDIVYTLHIHNLLLWNLMDKFVSGNAVTYFDDIYSSAVSKSGGDDLLSSLMIAGEV